MESENPDYLRDDQVIQIGTDILGLSPTAGSERSTTNLPFRCDSSSADLQESLRYRNDGSSQDETDRASWIISDVNPVTVLDGGQELPEAGQRTPEGTPARASWGFSVLIMSFLYL